MKYFSLFASAWLALTGSLCASHNEVKLSDFEGNYMSYGFSIGWTPDLALPNGSFAASRSQGIVSQFSINERGVGIFNFISTTFHNGLTPFGTTLSTNQLPVISSLPFYITITDPSAGTGSMIFSNFPLPGNVLTYDFVSDKRVDKIWFNSTNVPGTTNSPSNNAAITIAERQ